MILTFIAEATRVASVDASALPVPPPRAIGPGHECLAAKAEELKEWERHLRENNVEIEADFFWPNGARAIHLRDPAGNGVEIADKTPWRRG